MRASGVPRGDIFLCTKVSHEYLRADDFARSVDESLENLGVDYVDLLLVHWPNAAIPLAETMGALAKAKRDGLTRHIGVANFNIALLDRGDRAVPGAAGRPAGRVPSLSRPAKLLAACRAARHRLHRLLPARRAAGCSSDPVLARDRRATTARPSRRWRCAGSSSRASSSPIPRSSNPQRIAENLDVFDFALSDDEMTRIGALKRPDGRIANPAGRAPAWD